MKTSQSKPECRTYDLLLAADICRELRISRRTLDEWLVNGKILRGTKIGHRLYWRRSDFTKWLESRFAGVCRQ